MASHGLITRFSPSPPSIATIQFHLKPCSTPVLHPDTFFHCTAFNLVPPLVLRSVCPPSFMTRQRAFWTRLPSPNSHCFPWLCLPLDHSGCDFSVHHNSLFRQIPPISSPGVDPLPTPLPYPFRSHDRPQIPNNSHTCSYSSRYADN